MNIVKSKIEFVMIKNLLTMRISIIALSLMTLMSCSKSYEYVDLGLPSGNLWATMNVGAEKIEDYGELYAWGETSTKDKYSEENYTFHKNSLDMTDDVANKKMGGAWRMPTQKDFEELLDNCSKEWTDYQGVKGYKFTSPNGNWLFLPAAGYSYNYGRSREGNFGYYWSSSLSSDNPYDAGGLRFYSGGVGVGYDYRYGGFSVRAVCPSGKK